MSFAAGITLYKRELDEAKLETKKKFARDIISFLNEASQTPVLTGALVAHWFARTSPDFPSFRAERTDVERIFAAAREFSEISTFNEDGSIFIGNTAPYAGFVNDGVGPQGQPRRAWAMVERTVANFS